VGAYAEFENGYVPLSRERKKREGGEVLSWQQTRREASNERRVKKVSFYNLREKKKESRFSDTIRSNHCQITKGGEHYLQLAEEKKD